MLGLLSLWKQDISNISLTGHNHIVNHVDWSHCGSRLLTSSDDRTAAVWVKGQSEPVLKFKGVQRSVSTDGSKNFLVWNFHSNLISTSNFLDSYI